MMKLANSVLLAVLGLSLNVNAQTVDPNRDLLIGKLEHVQLNLAPNDPSRTAVTLRLADLLAERARQASMQELDSGCTKCTAGLEDRKKAFSLYSEVVEKTNDGNKGKVLIQMGHLTQLSGESDKALAIYARALKEVPTPAVQAEAHLAVAEIQFKQRKFKEAGESYGKVLATPGAASKGLAAYRQAWCQFNMGDLNGATASLWKILQTPELLTRTGAAQAQADVQFQEEVSRDLSTFLARQDVKTADLEKLEGVSPEKAKVSNLLNVGQEAARLGRNADAVKALDFAFERLQKPEDRISVLGLRTNLRFGLGDVKAASADFERGLSLWAQNKGCGQMDCAEQQRVFRRFVTEWNKLEKQKPSKDLTVAYEKYLAVFPEDSEMAMWGAQVARTAGEPARAEAFYDMALKAAVAGGKADEIENVLLTRLEFADDSKDESLRRRAYDSYLATTKLGKKSFEVRYQLAHLQYEKTEYGPAAENLRTLALDQKGDAKLRKQAADLSLDALVLLKDETRLEAWSGEYAAAFGPAAGKDFAEVRQKTILSRSAALAEKDPAQAWTVLAGFKAADAAPEDRVKAAKNKILLAEKLRKLPEARSATEDLLNIPNLSAEDREFALGRKAWFAELALDFNTALTASEKMSFAGVAPDQKFLKLAVFAELAGSPKSYYGQYLQATRDEDAKRAVAAELVRKAKDPVKELAAQKKILEKDPALWARLNAEQLQKGTLSLAAAKTVAADAKVRATPEGRLLWRTAFLREFATFQAKLAAHQLQSDTQKKLASTIKARGSLLEQLDKTAGEAIKEGDWAAQVVVINTVAKENERFYQDLLGAPMPAGLSGEEEQQYLQILSQQAAPYQSKAEQAKVKTAEFWSAGDAVKDLQTALNGDFSKLVEEEIGYIRTAAPEAESAKLAGLQAGAKKSTPSLQDLEAARGLVRQNPFDRAAVEALFKLEKDAGHVAMAGYLESRLSNWKEVVQ